MKTQRKQQLSRLMGLALPIMVEQLLRITLGNINILLLGRVSDAAVAAVGVANQFISMGQMILTISATGAAVVISSFLGAGKEDKAELSGLTALVMSLGLGMIFCPILAVFPRQLLCLTDLDKTLLPDASVYLRIVGGALFLHGLFAVLGAICRCKGLPRLPMYGILIMNLLNLVGTILCVKLVPADSVRLVMIIAFVNAGSTLIGFVFLLTMTAKRLPGVFRFTDLCPFPFDLLGDVIRIGLPSGLESLSYNTAAIITTAMVTSLGTTVIAAKTYLNSIVGYIYLAGMCFGQANQFLIAELSGAGKLDEAVSLGKKNFPINLSMNLLFSLSVFVFRHPLTALITDSPETAALISQVLLVDIAIQGCRAMNHCFNLCLRSVGDVRFTFILMIFSTWCISLPMSWFFAIKLNMGLSGIWLGMALDEGFRGAVSCARWCSNRWRPHYFKHLRKIEEAKKKAAGM